MRNLTFVFLIPILISCASVPPVCRPGNARSAGYSQAMRGERIHYGQGVVCEDEHYSIFKTHFQNGYMEGKQRYCAASYVRTKGVSDGKAGHANRFNFASYEVCDNGGALKGAYNQGYKEGLGNYCSREKVARSGKSDGEAGRSNSFSSGKYEICGAAKIKAFKNAYRRAHRQGLRTFCSGGSAASQGTADGTAGRPRVVVTAKFSVCKKSEQAQIQKAYDRGYETGFTRFCSPASINSAALQNAKISATAQFPSKFNSCLTKFPALQSQYTQAFEPARDRYVLANCTYDKGVKNGKSDGTRSNRKNTSIPVFCDRSLFGVYLNGYLEGWKLTKSQVCSETIAYNKGMSDAHSSRAKYYAVPANCPGEYHAKLQQKYREGYHFVLTQKGGGKPVGPIVITPYNPKAARQACRRADYTRNQCINVNSLICIRKGHHPTHCRFSQTFIRAVDACLLRGYSPRQCKYVRKRKCIQKGKPPTLCR